MLSLKLEASTLLAQSKKFALRAPETPIPDFYPRNWDLRGKAITAPICGSVIATLNQSSESRALAASAGRSCSISRSRFAHAC
jgi:hypothetical protein